MRSQGKHIRAIEKRERNAGPRIIASLMQQAQAQKIKKGKRKKKKNKVGQLVVVTYRFATTFSLLSLGGILR